MLSYCLKCRKYTKSKNVKVSKTNNEKLMLVLKCALFDSQELRLVKKQEASGLLSSLGLKAPFSKIPLLGDILFQRYKMNEIVSNFHLAGDKFIPEMHLRQPQIYI